MAMSGVFPSFVGLEGAEQKTSKTCIPFEYRPFNEGNETVIQSSQHTMPRPYAMRRAQVWLQVIAACMSDSCRWMQPDRRLPTS